MFSQIELTVPNYNWYFLIYKLLLSNTVIVIFSNKMGKGGKVSQTESSPSLKQVKLWVLS